MRRPGPRHEATVQRWAPRRKGDIRGCPDPSGPTLAHRRDHDGQITESVHLGEPREQTSPVAFERDDRPWGNYHVLLDEPDYKVKQILVRPKRRLSYQRHARRSEHWFVVRGLGLVTLDGRCLELGAGQAIDIPCGAAHRIENV